MSSCAACGAVLDERDHAVCVVCAEARLCLACGRRHLCTSECASRGCREGLCVKRVRDGIAGAAFGVDASPGS